MKIEYPTQTTYYICRLADNSIIAYGSVEPQNVMETIHPTTTYLDKSEYEAVLIAEGIEI